MRFDHNGDQDSGTLGRPVAFGLRNSSVSKHAALAIATIPEKWAYIFQHQDHAVLPRWNKVSSNNLLVWRLTTRAPKTLRTSSTATSRPIAVSLKYQGRGDQRQSVWRGRLLPSLNTSTLPFLVPSTFRFGGWLSIRTPELMTCSFMVRAISLLDTSRQVLETLGYRLKARDSTRVLPNQIEYLDAFPAGGNLTPCGLRGPEP